MLVDWTARIDSAQRQTRLRRFRNELVRPGVMDRAGRIWWPGASLHTRLGREAAQGGVARSEHLAARPAMITVGATVIALFPLAIHGGPLWEPLCYAQIGGFWW